MCVCVWCGVCGVCGVCTCVCVCGVCGVCTCVCVCGVVLSAVRVLLGAQGFLDHIARYVR